MAGEWVKMRIDLATDPAVISIAAALGLDEDTVVGKLHRLWSWASLHTTDGYAPGVNLVTLERYASVTKLKNVTQQRDASVTQALRERDASVTFLDAMVSVGWLEVTPEGIRFPKWDTHNSQSAKKKALASRRAAKSRAKKQEAEEEKRNAGSVTKLENVTRERDASVTFSESPSLYSSSSNSSSKKKKKPVELP